MSEIALADLPSVSDGVDDNTKITWDFSLPPSLDSERLVLDTRRLDRVMSVAAFRLVEVHECSGEVSTFTPGIAGLDGHGVAQATLSGQLQPADMQQSHLGDDYSEPLMGLHGKTSVIAKFNKPEIVSKVVDAKRGEGLSDEAAWAQQLNAAMTQSLRTSAHDHLVGREDRRLDRYVSRTIYGATVGSTGYDIWQQQFSYIPTGYLALGVIMVAAQAAATKSLTGGDAMLKERRWSLTPLGREQWDRRLAVLALTQPIVPIIKARK